MTIYVSEIIYLFIVFLNVFILRYILYSGTFYKYFRNTVNSHNNSMGLVLYPHFTDRETEALRLK